MTQPGNISATKFIPGIAWFFVILVLIATPGKDIPSSTWLELMSFDKVVHMGVFGLLAVLFCMPFRKAALPAAKKLRYFIIIAILTSAWGYCTELIQYFWIPDRTYDLKDWVADSVGALVAFFFCRKLFI